MAIGFAIGNKFTATAAGPMLGAEQIEQEWCDVWDCAGCEWTAWMVPMAKTNPMHKTHSVLAMSVRSRVILIWQFLAGV
jgi:hypothetical protein